MFIGSEEIYQETKASLKRIQNFDVNTLPRKDELGEKLNFSEAVEPASILIELYKRLSLIALEDFPDTVLNAIKASSQNDYNILKQALDFDTEQQNPSNARNDIISRIENTYAGTFTKLHPYIAYSLHRSADFQTLDTNARATLQTIKDQANTITKELTKHEGDAKKVLSEIRSVAAEEGVTQQAAHFKAECENQTSQAEKWQGYVIKLAIALGVFAIISLFLHKIPLLKPENTYDAIQLSISKFLIFFVIAYMMFLSAKNFLSHKHNAIVNKHRQNALLTHRALVEASGDEGVRDAVLLHASSCIFSPQPTGYSNDGKSEISNQKSVVEILSKPIGEAAKKAG